MIECFSIQLAIVGILLILHCYLTSQLFFFYTFFLDVISFSVRLNQPTRVIKFTYCHAGWNYMIQGHGQVSFTH